MQIDQEKIMGSELTQCIVAVFCRVHFLELVLTNMELALYVGATTKTLPIEAQLLWKRSILNRICMEAKAKHKEFDALIPLSGGKDSTYILYVARKELGLKCLAYTLDFAYLSDFARGLILILHQTY